MRKLFSILALLFCCFHARATLTSNFVATITITNTAGTTNGQTLTVAGNTRTWTNSVFIAASQIKTNNTIAGAAVNLTLQVANTPFSGLSLGADGLTYIKLTTAQNVVRPTITLSAGWASLTWATNYFNGGTVVRIPPEIETLNEGTNIASQIALYLSRSTNPIALTATGGTNLFPTTIMSDAFVGGYLYKRSPDGLTYGTWDGLNWTNIQWSKNSTNANLAGWATNAGTSTSATNATNFFGTLYATNFSFATIVATTAPTNFILDFKGATYRKVILTNDCNILFSTNAPGVITLDLLPGGGDRLLTVSTNWILLDTNNWYQSGPLWTRVITNAQAGNGWRRFVFSVRSEDATNVQTNTVATGTMSP